MAFEFIDNTKPLTIVDCLNFGLKPV